MAVYKPKLLNTI